MSVSVVIPYRDTGRGIERRQHLQWILAALEREHPEWEVVVSSDGRSGDEMWSAATARVRGVKEAAGNTIVLLDSDTWSKHLARAVELVETGTQRWVMPHSTIVRLSAAQTFEYQRTLKVNTSEDFESAPYANLPGGVPTVITRELFEACPPDVRFNGWGAEDNCWGFALTTLHQQCWRLPADAVHFWHEPDARRAMRQRRDRAEFEDPEHTRLAFRYWQANGRPEEMKAIVSEHLHQGVST